MDHSQLVQRPGRSHIQELDIAVLRRIIFFGRVIEDDGVEFQPFCIFHWKDHDPFCKFGCFQAAVCEIEFTAECFVHSESCHLIPADDGDGLSAVCLPFPDRLYCFTEHASLVAASGHPDRIPVPLDRVHRIDREIPMFQDAGGKVRDLHGISVAFLQHTEPAGYSLQHQTFQIFPVVQPVSVMDILGDVPHDRVGAVPKAVGERAVRHHTEILRLVDDHMARLADAVRLFDPFVNVGKRRQVIKVKIIFGEGDSFPVLIL